MIFRIASMAYAGGSQAFAYDDDGFLITGRRLYDNEERRNGLPERVTDRCPGRCPYLQRLWETDGVAYAIGGNEKYNYSLTRDLPAGLVQKVQTVAGANPPMITPTTITAG